MYESRYERYHSVQRHPLVQFRLLMLDFSGNSHYMVNFKMAAIKIMKCPEMPHLTCFALKLSHKHGFGA